jgi:hypothetical protein
MFHNHFGMFYNCFRMFYNHFGMFHNHSGMFYNRSGMFRNRAGMFHNRAGMFRKLRVIRPGLWGTFPDRFCPWFSGFFYGEAPKTAGLEASAVDYTRRSVMSGKEDHIPAASSRP